MELTEEEIEFGYALGLYSVAGLNEYNIQLLRYLKEWGDNPREEYYPPGMSPTALLVYNLMLYDGPLYGRYQMHSHLLSRVLSRVEFDQSREVPDQIALYPDRATFERGENKKMRTKPGRAIRRILPFLTDKEVDQMVDEFRNQIAIDPSSYVFKSGETQEDFVHAYSHEQAPTANLDTTPNHKSLANSCMRHEFDGQSVHPCAVYASGDFTIHWAENKYGRIAARCIVRNSNKKAGPIYAVNQIVVDLMQERLDDLGVTFARNGDWNGAELLLIEENGGYVGPYIDIGPQALAVSSDGSSLVISDRGWIDASDYDGILHSDGRSEQCSHCEEYYHDEDMAGRTEDHDQICDDCAYNHYTRCDCTSLWISDCEIETVHLIRYGTETTESWGPNAIRCYATWIPHREEYWHDSDVIYDVHTTPITSADIDEGAWVMNDDGEYVPASEYEEQTDEAA